MAARTPAAGTVSATAAAGATAAATTSGAYLVPHSGQASAASSQHQRHAKTSQAGQWHRPTHGPIAAVSTDVPQRSQKGSGAPPGSRAPCLAGLRAASFRGAPSRPTRIDDPDDRRSLPTDGPTLARPRRQTKAEAGSRRNRPRSCPGEGVRRGGHFCHASRASITSAAPTTLTLPTHDLAAGAALTEQHPYPTRSGAVFQGF